MKTEVENLSAEERSVLDFLKHWPGKYVSAAEIARRAGGKNRYREDPRWVSLVLPQLVSENLIETDGSGKYRFRMLRTVKIGGKKRFIAPHLGAILEQHDGKFDLSA